MSNSENNKRIAKNTFALYFRQIITMGVALFTSRIVLQALGVTDFGINNVVAGVVGMFGILSGTLMAITQRFLTFELGRGNTEVLKKIFSTSMILHLSIGIITIIFSETIGLWFLNNKLVIPPDRIAAARWVFQFTVFGFLLSLFNSPLMALITSHEDMHIYGYLGILDVLIRLITAYLLLIINVDKLVFFAVFGFIASCIVSLIYFIYCKKKYQETRFSFIFDKSLLKELSGFGGYVFVGNIFWILRIKGTNILLNMFYGPAVNAAAGLANSVNAAIQSFGNNFRQALNPQLTKSYAQNDKDQVWSLLERGTRFTFFLLLVFSVPILLKTEFVLKLWLKNVPEYTTIITKLMILNILVEATFVLLNTIILATGNLKMYYYITYITSIISFLFFYLICKFKYDPFYVFLILPIITFLFIPIRFLILRNITNFSIIFFIRKSLLPIIIVTIISFLPFYYTNKLISETYFNSFIILLTSAIWTLIIIILVGLRKNERIKIYFFLKNKIIKK